MNIVIGVMALICLVLTAYQMEYTKGGVDGIQAALYLIAAAVAFHA